MKFVIALFAGLILGCCIFVLPKLDSAATDDELSIRSLPTIPTSMSVARAYDEIPHRRTTFQPSYLDTTPEEQDYLQSVFTSIDQGIVLRVSTLHSFQSHRFDPKFLDAYDQLVAYVGQLTPPAKLKRYHRCIEKSLEAQATFYRDWLQNKSNLTGETINRSRRVKSASAQLRRAYGILIQLYPQANESTRRAFFDYHCALDFI